MLKTRLSGAIAKGIPWIILGYALLAPGTASAFTQVTLVAGTNESVERAFLQATTTYFDGELEANRFAPNTWTFKLKGIKSLPPIVNPVDGTQVVRDALQQSSYTYVYGWANGVSYQRYQDLLSISDAYEETVSTDAFCSGVLSDLSHFIYQQNFSTPTVVPGF